MANALIVDKLWTHIGVEYAQGLGITNLYPANIRVVSHGSEVREGMV